MVSVVSYRNLAIDAITKCMGYDPYLPQTAAMVDAWAEALERNQLNNEADVMEAVAIMYQRNGEPNWRATPKVLVSIAREVRKARLIREEEEREAALAVEKISLAEFRRRHPDVEFPTFGRDPSDVVPEPTSPGTVG